MDYQIPTHLLRWQVAMRTHIMGRSTSAWHVGGLRPVMEIHMGSHIVHKDIVGGRQHRRVMERMMWHVRMMRCSMGSGHVQSLRLLIVYCGHSIHCVAIAIVVVIIVR